MTLFSENDNLMMESFVGAKASWTCHLFYSTLRIPTSQGERSMARPGMLTFHWCIIHMVFVHKPPESEHLTVKG